MASVPAAIGRRSPRAATRRMGSAGSAFSHTAQVSLLMRIVGNLLE